MNSVFKILIASAVLGFLGSSYSLAQAPVITSPTSITGTVGTSMTVSINATNNPVTYSVSELPSGLSLNGNLILGIPTEEFSGDITIRATNANDETGTSTVPVTIELPNPVITSSLSEFGTVGIPFSYKVAATNNPTNYSAVGASLAGLTMNATTGVLSGTPTSAGTYQIQLTATNNSGNSGTAILTLIVGTPTGTPTPPTVDITFPNYRRLISGKASGFQVIADIQSVTSGEAIASAVVVLVDPDSLEELVQLATMELDTSDNLYKATVSVGPDYLNQQVPGGNWVIRVKAYQTNADDPTDLGTDDVRIRVGPVLTVLWPTEEVYNDTIYQGDVYASVKYSTNAFKSISARLTGPGVVFLDEVDVQSSNDVYNFLADRDITAEGEYEVTFTATDTNNVTTVLTTTFRITYVTGLPVVQIQGVPQGYFNNVFVPAVVKMTRTTHSVVANTNMAGDIVSFTASATYDFELLVDETTQTTGAGMYPRNGITRPLPIDALTPLGFNFNDYFVNGEMLAKLTIVNGRATGISETITTDALIFTVAAYGGVAEASAAASTAFPETQETYIGASGMPGQVPINLNISPSTADVVSYDIFVNGQIVKTGDPLNLEQLPIMYYPFPDNTGGAPPAGDYIIEANIVDADGKVGTAYPVRFSIIPSDVPTINISSPADESVYNQGDIVTFIVNADDITKISTIQIRNLLTNQLSTATRVDPISGEPYFRASITFDQPGLYSMVAVATDIEGEVSYSLPVTLTVQAFSDLSVSITEPTTDTTVIRGGTVSFDVSATSSQGVATIDLLRNATIISTATSTPATFSPLFDAVGSFSMTAQATDIYGTVRGASQDITVTVVETDLAVSFTAPTTNQSIVRGGSVAFTINASATPGVNSIELLVDGSVVATSNSVPATIDYQFSALGTYTVTARATDAYGNVRDSNTSIKVTVTQPVLTVSFTEPTTNRTIVQGTSLTIRVSTTSTYEVSNLDLSIGGTVVESSSGPFNFSYTFDTVGQFVVTAVATDSQGNTGTANNPFTVTVQAPNPLIRVNDFVVQTYEDIFYRTPSTNELNAGVAQIDAYVAQGYALITAKAQFVVDLLNSSEEENYTITEQEFRTMTGEWPDYDDLGTYTDILIASTATDDLTTALVPEYTDRFGSINTDPGFVDQLFYNKHGVSPNAQAEVRLNYALENASSDLSPGFSGDLVAYATQFSLDNARWPNNTELSSILKYPIPDTFIATAPPYAHAMVGLWRVNGEGQVDNAAVSNFSKMSLLNAVQAMLESPKYTDRFNNTSGLFGTMNSYGAVYSPWMSTWLFGSSAPWYYHQEMGWVYTDSVNSSSVWLYIFNAGDWFWTNEGTYPWVYVFTRDGGGWFYAYYEESTGFYWFINSNTSFAITK